MPLSPRRVMLVVTVLALTLTVVLPALPRLASATGSGSLEITKKNKTGTLLQDSCFALYADLGGMVRGRQVATQCDRYDGTPNNGKLNFVNVPAGSYVVVETRAPSGYALASDRVAVITEGETTRISVVDPVGGSTLTVTKVDSAGTRLFDACFDVYTDAGEGQLGVLVASSCDGFDGADGKTNLRGLRNGNYVLFEIGPPFGYQRANNVPFRVSASGSTVRLTVVNTPISERDNVVVKKVNSAGQPVAGACFELYLPKTNSAAPGGIDVGAYAGYVACDSYDGTDDGTIVIANVKAGSYVLVETVAPAGFQLAAYKPFTKSATSSRTLTITDRAGGARLRIKTVDGNGNLVSGGCVALHRVNSAGARAGFVAKVCDTPGSPGGDGEIVISSLPGRTYLAVEVRAPDGFRRASAVSVVVASNSETILTIRHRSLTSTSVAKPATPVATATPVAATETPAADPATPAPIETPATPEVTPETTPEATEPAVTPEATEPTVEAPAEGTPAG